MPTADRIPVDDMLSLMEAGEATPLLGEYDVGPTWYAGNWWHVPRGELDTGFIQADRESTREYYEVFVELAASNVTLGEQFADDPLELDDLGPDPATPEADPAADRGPDAPDAGDRR